MTKSPCRQRKISKLKLTQLASFQKVHISEPLTLSFSEAINYCDNFGLELPVPSSLLDNKKLLGQGLFSFVHQSET